jgi:hypothetical protein
MNAPFLLFISIIALLTSTPNFPPPPGTSRIADNMYLDKRPVTYLDYYEFVHHVKINDPDLIDELAPEDTGITYQNDILWNNRNYEDFPIVGLSPVQIQSYCKWRSDMVNKNIEDTKLRCSDDKYWKKFDKIDPGKKFTVVYSLPSGIEVQKHHKHFKNQQFDELLSDGMMEQESKNISGYNKDNLYTFRCMAEFILKN